MLDMALSSIGLFLRGKLFADPGKALTQVVIGTVATLLLFLISVKLLAVPLWLAAVFAGFAGGALQPYLFKDLKYR